MASATYSNMASSAQTRRHSIPSLLSASHFSSSSSAAPPLTGTHRLTLIARARLEKFQGQDTITLPDVVVDDPQLPQFQVPEDEDLIRGDGNGIPHSHSPLSLLDFEIGDRRAQRESSQSSGVVLPVLVESSYRASTIPYRFPSDNPKEATPTELSWINLFAYSIPSFRKRAESDDTVSDAHIKAEKFALRYSEILDDLKRDPQSHGGPPDCILLCQLREQVLRELGFRDIFKRVKEEENAKAMALFEAVVRHNDAIPDEAARVENLIKGIFAGNIFDLGSAQLEELFAKDGMSFQATCQNLLPRPWVIDDLDKFVSNWGSRSWKKVVIFVDNSGVDIILGILPFARELLRLGAQVVLAANDLPSVNDVTYTKLIEIIAKLKDKNGTLLGVDASNLVIANSGNDLPVIDLTRVSQELAYLASDADLVVLEGMGRGIETNLYAQFRCDSLNIAMVKHPEVAQFLGGRLYDCVIKYNEFSY